MPVATCAIEIEDLADPRVEAYRDIKDRNLRQRDGLFVVEGRINIRWMLEASPYRPISLLLSPAAHEALGDVLAGLDPLVTIYVASHEVLAGVLGIKMHRGCLALVRRPEEMTLESLLSASAGSAGSRLLVLEGLTNHDNVGGIFRNAMAFGVDGVLLCPRCCDPLYRKSIRTSMGGALSVPFARADSWPAGPISSLKRAGYSLLALDPAGEAIESVLLPAPAGKAAAPLALVLGTEGTGLSEELLDLMDRRLRIDMVAGADSLNVSTATGIALHYLFIGGTPDGTNL